MSNFWLDKKNSKITIESLQAENVALSTKIDELYDRIDEQDKAKTLVEEKFFYLGGKLADLESEYNQKLEEAYGQLSKELQAAEKVAEEGYQEAYDIICDLRNRLEVQGKNSDVKGLPLTNFVPFDARLYEEYEQKVKQMREYIVNKVDEFLNLKSQEMTPKEIRNAYTAQQIVEEATK